MSILSDLLIPLQSAFSNTQLGRERAQLFAYTLLSVTIPFTSSMTSNLLRTLDTLFGFSIQKQLYYRFMASPTLPWEALWCALWDLIPSPLTEQRLIVALDDCINPKVGLNIFGCETIFDHAAKANQAKYVWAQNIVSIGLLKQVKGRWACLPLAFRFYLPQKTIMEKKSNATKSGKVVEFRTKMAQAAEMLFQVSHHFSDTSVIVVTDSWFGNNGLYKLIKDHLKKQIHLVSRLRANSSIYELPQKEKTKRRGRKRKYGRKLGSVSELAKNYKHKAETYMVNLYGKVREVSAYEKVIMVKTLKCPVRVVWVYRKTQWVALFTTDLNLSVTQIIKYYGARWKIESGFKELKQEIGSQKSQTRNAHAVTNHLQFCMMSATLTWIYAERLKADPERRHKVKGRTSFAFSDIRRIIADEALSCNFSRLCPKPGKPVKKSFISTLLRMVA
jgi:SRSO17 transposase